MYTILKGAHVFSPSDLGKQDVLLAGGVIANIAAEITPAPQYGPVEVVNLDGHYVVPGFIDQHVHLIGGGGEGGFASRTPEVVLSDLILAGTTTVVGCLGTDGITRHMASLLAKARGLEEEGVSAYIYTGSYEVPPQTITGSVRSDLVLIDKVIGCGEVAISDHRSAQPAKTDIAKLAAEARVGGMLSGKAGVLHLHVGDGKQALNYLFEILAESELPITQFTPTHVNRTPALLAEGLRFVRLGGFVDFTAGMSAGLNTRPSKAIEQYLAEGAPIGQLTISSDGNGSMPRFNEHGETVGLAVARLDSLHEELKALVQTENLPLSDALRPITENPARSLRLFPRKGTVSVGADADVVVLNENLDIRHVYAKGRCMLADGILQALGTFEK